MEGWPSINAPSDWAPYLCPFTRPGREGCCQKPRRGAIDPATFPSCGWQLQCQRALGHHAALPRIQEGQPANSVSVVMGGKSHKWSACECHIHVNNPSKHRAASDVMTCVTAKKKGKKKEGAEMFSCYLLNFFSKFFLFTDVKYVCLLSL